MADEHTKKPVNSVERTGQVNDGSPKMSYQHQKEPQRQLISGSLEAQRGVQGEDGAARYRSNADCWRSTVPRPVPIKARRRMAAWLVIRGHLVNCRRVHRLMRLTGLAAIYQRPNTRKPTATHKVYPDLLDRPEIERGQSRLMLGRHPAFSRCRLYIPMAKGFLYLVAICIG